MNKYYKNYSIEWMEECEADNFEEAQKILDKQAQDNPDQEIIMSAEVMLDEE